MNSFIFKFFLFEDFCLEDFTQSREDKTIWSQRPRYTEALHVLANLPGLVQEDHAAIAVLLDMHTEVLFGFA